MFQMWSLMDWGVYCYDKISQWKANLMAISKRRILWSKVMLQINSGGRPSLSRFTPGVFHKHLLHTDCKGEIIIYLSTHPSIHYIYISIDRHLGWSLVNPNVSRLSNLTFYTLLTAIYLLIVDTERQVWIDFVGDWAQPYSFYDVGLISSDV